jgi:hypothetical protein
VPERAAQKYRRGAQKNLTGSPRPVNSKVRAGEIKLFANEISLNFAGFSLTLMADGWIASKVTPSEIGRGHVVRAYPPD